MKWDNHVYAYVDHCLAAGKTRKEIAAELGCSTGALGMALSKRRNAKRNAPVYPDYTPYEDQRLTQMCNHGWGLRAIAKRMGRSENDIKQRRRALKDAGASIYIRGDGGRADPDIERFYRVDAINKEREREEYWLDRLKQNRRDREAEWAKPMKGSK